LTVIIIPMITIRSGMNLLESAKIQAVDELSRHLSSRIPVPEFFNDEEALLSLDNKVSSKYKSLKRLTKSKDGVLYSSSKKKFQAPNN
jgi:hypothetical protein